MTSYQPIYVDARTGVSSMDTAYPSMRAAHARASDLVCNGMAVAGSITFRSAHGDKYTVADLEKILADNDVPFDPIT